MNPNTMAFLPFVGNPLQRIRMDLTPGGQHAPTQGFGAVDAQAADVPPGDFKLLYETITATNAQALVSTAVNAPVPLTQHPTQSVATEPDYQAILTVLFHQAGLSDPSPAVSSAAAEVFPLSPDPFTESGVKEPSGNDPENSADILGIALQGMAGETLPPLSAFFSLGDCAATATMANLISPQPGEQNGQAIADAASELISQALAEVSEALHLSVDPVPGTVSFSGASEDAARQLSEILYALKMISGALEDAVLNNQKTDAGAQAIDTAQAREMAQFVRIRIFRIEIGVSMLGMGDRVQSELARKPDLPSDGSIPQAIDPIKAAGPHIRIEALFGPMFSESEPNIATLARKIRELFLKYTQTVDTRQGTVNAGSAARSDASVDSIRSAQAGTVSPVDSQAMLRSLKREATSPLVLQNVEPGAQAAKPDTFVSIVKAAAKNPASATVDAMKEPIPFGDAGIKSAAMHVFGGVETKGALPAYKTLDETVMSQITERLHPALRSGINEIRIHLRPESLGDVQLRIRVEGDVVFARIQVESQQVKQIVENSMQFLKDSLSQQHLQTGSLEVNVGGEGWERKTEEQAPQTQYGPDTAALEKERESDDTIDASEMRIGLETGRRFGANTIEYFA